MKKVVWALPVVVLMNVAAARADEPAKTDAPPRTLATKPTPLTRVEGAKWEPSLGLVAEKDPAGGDATEKDEPSSRAVPALPSTSLTEFGVRIFAGIDQRRNVDTVNAVVGSAFRFEARHVDSFVAPWAEAGFSTTIFDATPQNENDSEDGFNWDIWLRGGVDVHPLRARWIGVGPFVGYRQLHLRALEQSFIVQGLDLGGQVHLRSHEAAGSPPAFDAIAYGFVQGAGLGPTENRTFIGALLSAGAEVRAFAQLEGCASSPDSCFPRQVRAVGGFGGVF